MLSFILLIPFDRPTPALLSCPCNDHSHLLFTLTANRHAKAKVVREATTNVGTEEQTQQEDGLANDESASRGISSSTTQHRRSHATSLGAQQALSSRRALRVPDVGGQGEHNVHADGVGNGGLELLTDGPALALGQSLLLNGRHHLLNPGHGGGNSGDEAEAQQEVRSAGEVGGRGERVGDEAREAWAHGIKQVEADGEGEEGKGPVDRGGVEGLLGGCLRAAVDVWSVIVFKFQLDGLTTYMVLMVVLASRGAF